MSKNIYAAVSKLIRIENISNTVLYKWSNVNNATSAKDLLSSNVNHKYGSDVLYTSDNPETYKSLGKYLYKIEIEKASVVRVKSASSISAGMFQATVRSFDNGFKDFYKAFDKQSILIVRNTFLKVNEFVIYDLSIIKNITKLEI